jgi:hypothetical protein
MNKKSRRLCLVYGYDTEFFGNETENDTLQCGKGTKERCDLTLVHIMREGNGTFTIPLGAGKDPKLPDYPELKYLMRDYLRSMLVANGYAFHVRDKHTLIFRKEHCCDIHILCSKGNKWSTFPETWEMIHTVDGSVFDEVIIFSHEFHLKRIKQSLTYFGEIKEYKVMWFSCKGEPGLWELFLEPIKAIKVWVLGTFYLKKLNQKAFA